MFSYCTRALVIIIFGVCLFAERPCPLPCANGGQCTSGICRCKGDFTGEYCETSGKMTTSPIPIPHPTLVPYALELHLGAQTIQECRYRLIKITQILGCVFYRYKQAVDLLRNTELLRAC